MNSGKLKLDLETIFSSKGKAKIIELLALNGELNITEIINLTGLNHASVVQHLNFFKDIDFIQEKNYGRIRIFRFRNENIKARAIKNLIELWKT